MLCKSSRRERSKPATVSASGRVREAVPLVCTGLWFHDPKHTHKAMMTNGRSTRR